MKRRKIRPNKEKRRWASFAATALCAFADETMEQGKGGFWLKKEPEDVVSDLLADIRHWCDVHGLDFESLDARAHMHYLEELKPKGERS